MDCDSEADGDGDVVGSSVTVSVASGVWVASALLGSSSRETEQPTSVPLPTNMAVASTAMTERYRVVDRSVQPWRQRRGGAPA